ncbi:MAG: ATP-dependent Clp protease adaptor ClpS [Phycisphaerales bacterium]|nr:ATP-dependent Clp protease adaptor ClpS [Phycisphaerales bacterium]
MSEKDRKTMAATPENAESTATLPETTKPRHLPMYKVILHNDDVSEIGHVIETILMLTPLTRQEAEEKTVEADRTGCSLLLVIHKERAELYAEQFQSRGLTITIEPAD